MSEGTYKTEQLHARAKEIVGPARVSARPDQLEAYGRDAWPRSLLLVREKVPLRRPQLVVWPERIEEVVALTELALELEIPLIPYGAGSGVCGGVHPLRGGLSLAMSHFDKIGKVDPLDRLVHVGAGVNGQLLEDALARQGYTLGHFPSSISCSTVGGWVAARGAGQCSSRYGKIEDLVSGLEFVSGAGRRYVLPPTPSLGHRPSMLQLLIGSEGVLGTICGLWLRVRRAPELRRMRGVLMPNIGAGLAAIEAIFGTGLRPAVARLYDPLDSFVNKGKGKQSAKPLAGSLDRRRLGPQQRGLHDRATRLGLSHPGLLNRAVAGFGRRSLLILGSEGSERSLVEREAEETLRQALALGGKDLGSGPGDHWLAHRHAVSFKLAPMLAAGAFVDTMEVATTWDRLQTLYKAVRTALRDQAFVMAHFSHAYEDGASIYFTFAGYADTLEAREAAYDRCWSVALATVLRCGATLSHHHGVGMSKQGSFRQSMGAGGMALLEALHHQLDPKGLCNPGKLGLGAGPALPGGDRSCDPGLRVLETGV